MGCLVGGGGGILKEWKEKPENPWTSRLNNSAPRCWLQNQGSPQVPFPFFQSSSGPFSFSLYRAGGGAERGLSFPGREVQGAHTPSHCPLG